MSERPGSARFSGKEAGLRSGALLLARGPLRPGKLRALCEDRTRPPSPALEELIEKEWQLQTEQAARAGRVLYDGLLLRLDSFEWNAEHDELLLHLGTTRYREFLGTNLAPGRRPGEFPRQSFADPVGTSALVLTRDGRVLLGRRSHRVAFHAGFVHTFGGMLEAADQDPRGGCDPFRSIRRELAEELALEDCDLEDVIFRALVRAPEIHQPELLFEARTHLAAAEVEARWRGAAGKDEHDALVSLPASADGIRGFLATCSPLAPVAFAALELQESAS